MAMKCKDCPVFGHEYYKLRGKALCFCIGHPTSNTDFEADCKYGINDYEEYLLKLMETIRKEGKEL